MQEQIVTFLTIRRAIGWLAVSLPFILILGTFVFGDCCQVQPSISHYYYTKLRDVLVGTLCAVSLFLFSYKGYEKSADNILAHLAGFFCLFTALVPTDIDCGISLGCFGLVADCNPCQYDTVSLINFPHREHYHLFAAGCFYAILSYMSIFLFTKSDKVYEDRTPQKHQRNLIYKICGYITLASTIAVGVYRFGLHGNLRNTVVFWFETIGLVSFGISWLTKGEIWLKDEEREEERLTTG
jgi:hypothetical protein